MNWMRMRGTCIDAQGCIGYRENFLIIEGEYLMNFGAY
jgi:hypothetical protein